MKSCLILCATILVPSIPAWPTCQDGKLEWPDEFSMFSALAWSPDGKFVAGARMTGGQVVLWNAATGKIRATLKRKGKDRLDWLTFSGDGKVLVAVDTGSGIAFVWDMRSGRLVRSFPLGGKIFGFAGHARISLGGKGRILATVGERIETIQGKDIQLSGTLAVWDLRTGRPKWKKGKSNVRTLAVSPDGKTLVTTTATPANFKISAEGSSWEHRDPHLRLLAASSGKEGKGAALTGAGPQRLAVSPDGKTIAGLGFSRLDLWDAKTLEPTGGCNWGKGRSVFHSFAFSKDGKRVARAALEWADVVEVDGGEVLGLRKTSFPNFWTSAAYSPDLKRMACLRKGPILIDLSRKE